MFVEAHPRRVVGVAIDDAADVFLLYYLLDLSYEVVATIAVDVETYMADADDVALGGLHREAGIDEEDGGLALLVGCEGMMPDGEGGEGALHGACCGYAAEGVDIHSDECLYKF